MPNGMVLARDPLSGTSPPYLGCRCHLDTMGAPALLALQNILDRNPLRARRGVLVAVSLLQPMVTLERPTANRSDLMSREPLGEYVPVRPLTAEPFQNAPVFPPDGEST